MKQPFDKRDKSVGHEVNPVLMLIEMKRELEARIFALEQRCAFLESKDVQRGLSGTRIGGR